MKQSPYFRKHTPRRVILTLAGLSVVTSSALYAQVDTGVVTGTVTDPSGAVVSNAQIHLHDEATGYDRVVSSSGTGEYLVPSLPIGTYKTTITAPGFSEFAVQVTVNVGGHATVDAKLEAGSSTTVIQVGAQDEATQVNTVNQEISQVINPREVLDLPSLTRNPYDFVVLSGNTSQDPGGSTARGVGAALNGQRAAGTEVLLDGVENADNYDATVGQQIPLDAVEEYRIITNGFDAQYGRASGGVVNLATKSGTNRFHGSLYEYNRVSDLAANTYYEDAANAANRASGLPNNPSDHFTRNQFGYSVGGPILRDKLFFFNNFEWNRIRSTGSKVYEIPSAAFLASSSPLTQAYFHSFGTVAAGTVLGTTVPVTGFAVNPLQVATVSAPVDAGAGAPLNQWYGLTRFDYNLNSKITMFFRAGNLNDSYTAGYNSLSPYQGFDTGQTDFNQAYLFGLNYAISPSLVSTSKVSFSRLNTNQPLNGTALVPGLYLNQANTQSTDSSTSNPIALPGYLPLSPGGALPFGGPANTYQFLENISYTIKAHTMNFGGQFLQLRDNRTFGASENATQLISKSGTPLASALTALQTGNVYQYGVAVNPQGHLPCSFNPNGTLDQTPACSIVLPATSPDFERENTFNDGNWYAEDQWKVTPRFTFDYGIRWEYYGVQHNHNPNLESNFYLGAGTNLAQQVADGQIATTPNSPVGGLVAQDKNNYAPRIGFAFDPGGDGKWAIRGGYGISYERNFGNVTYNVIQNPPNYAGVQLTSTASTQYQISTTNFGPFAGNSGQSVALPPSSLRAVQSNIPTAYTHQYQLSVEHQIAPNDLLAIEYSGAHGVHQYAIANLNGIGFGTFLGNTDPTPATAYSANRLNHEYGSINYREANGTSHYDAVNVRLNASNLQSIGLQLIVNYTFSHALDNLSSTFSESGNNFNLGYLNPFNPSLDYGNADYDIRHRLTIGGLYEPKVLEFRQNAALHAIFGGLEFAPIATLSTGTPFTIYDCTNAENACPRIVAAPGLSYHGSPVANGGVDSYNFIALPAASANPFANSQGYSDFPDTLGGQQNSGIGRNQFYGPNRYTFDAGVYKNVHLGLENKYTVQLRGEFYNVLNHHNFYPVTGDADFAEESEVEAIKGSPTGSPSSSDERRNVQLALRFEF